MKKQKAIKKKFRKVKTLIDSGADLLDISKALSELTVEEVEDYCIGSAGGFHYDLMHVAVNANRRDVVECMFSKDLFLPSKI